MGSAGVKWEKLLGESIIEDVEHYIYLLSCGSVVREKEVLDKRMEE